MGYEKIVTLAERCAKYAQACGKRSIPKTKPVQIPNGKVLEFLKRQNCDSVNLSNILENTIKDLKSSELLKISATYPQILKKSEQEIAQLIKHGNIPQTQQQELIGTMKKLNEYSYDYFVSKIGRDVSDLTAADKELVNSIGREMFSIEIKFLKTFDNILFPLSKNPRAIEIEKELSRIGVNARISDNLEEGEILLNACKMMQQRGINIFPKYRCVGALDGWGGFGVPDQKVNEGYVILGDIHRELRKARPGLFVERTGEGVVAHETAHILNTHLGIFDNISEISWQANPNIKPETIEILKKYISQYSADSPHEAGSEIFAAVIEGKTINEDIMNIVKEYKFIMPN